MAILKKSQIIAEFVIMTGIAMVFAIMFIIAVGQNKSLQDTKEFFLLKDIGLKIRDEISMTSNAEDGYSRQFVLPETLVGRNYSIAIKNNTLIVRTSSTLYITSILNVTGYIRNGSNSITKANGMIYAN